MRRSIEEARDLLQQEPGRECRHANATCNPNIARRDLNRHRSGGCYRITPANGKAFKVVLAGRDKWALDRLRAAGRDGCTPITEPAPRWSAYVFNLRALGLEIETVHEPHGDDFPGHHARYVLQSTVVPMSDGGAA